MGVACCKRTVKPLNDALDETLDPLYRKRIIGLFVFLLLGAAIGACVIFHHLRKRDLQALGVAEVSLNAFLIAIILVLFMRTKHWQKRLLDRAHLEGNVQVPEGVEVSWTQGGWRLRPESRQEESSDSSNKLAFLFNIASDLPLKEVWDKFFQGAQANQFLALVHCTDPTAPQDLHLGFKYKRIDSVKTSYGAAVPAQQALIKEALADLAVSGAVIVSAACVPVKCFDAVHKQLFGPAANQGPSILNFANSLFEKCAHWHFQTREFMEKYVRDDVGMEVSPTTGSFITHLSHPAHLLKLHHSQEEFYPAAIAVRYHLPCRHGVVTLDIWDRDSPILTRGLKFDPKARQPPASPLTFSALTLDFLEKIADSEICFLRKVNPTDANIQMLLARMSPLSTSVDGKSKTRKSERALTNNPGLSLLDSANFA